MEEILQEFMRVQPLGFLFAIIAVFIFILVKGANLLVVEAVGLSVRLDVPKTLIGATVVSLGTTLPEAAVSVLAAATGRPSLALGNAVGSIICDTGLILGIATLLGPVPLNRAIVNRQGWLQLAAGFLLVFCSLPFCHLTRLFETGGRLVQAFGFFFLVLLVAYIWISLRWVKGGDDSSTMEYRKEEGGAGVVLLKLTCAIALVVVSSWMLIPAVEETAVRLRVPDSIIAATLVALGTSLPELVTAVTAVRKNHGELAVGNIIGADILNVLFVAGAASAVTPGGLVVTPDFYLFLFPAMLAVLVVFRIGIFVCRDRLTRTFGILLLIIYTAVTVISYSRSGLIEGG